MSLYANQDSPDLLGSNILVVDDEKANVILLEKTLEAHGYQHIVGIQDPRLIMSLLQEREFDLILLDLNMPYLNGFDVIKQLNESTLTQVPPILVLTAQSSQEFRIKALTMGARDYVTKPFDQIELIARVRNLLEVQSFHRYLRDQNLYLEHKIFERTHALTRTRLQIVQRLGRAAEYRDNETGLHIIRMSKISAILAGEIGMSPYDTDLILNASPMHDIGKIGIPDQVLLKPGRLAADEWDVMKQHPVIGADILSGDDSDLLSMAKSIALTHHEKWDGSGYPHGLYQDEIPLVGRIVAVADVFDALTSDRPYKQAWSSIDSLDYIRDNAKRHFDPRLVECFFDNIETIQDIKNAYADPH